MASRGKFTLFFMQDSGKVYRLRFGRAVPVFLGVVIGLLLLIGGLGGWSWLRWCEARHTWQAEREELLTLLGQNRMALERLSGRLAQREEAQRTGDEEDISEAQTAYQSTLNRQIVSIRESSFVLTDPRTLRIVLDMYNVRPPKPLTGRIMFSLRTADDRVLPLIHEDTHFDIIRFRRFNLTAALPSSPEDIRKASVLLEVLIGGEVVFRNLYPVR